MVKIIERERQIREYEISQLDENVLLTCKVIVIGISLSSKAEALGCFQRVCESGKHLFQGVCLTFSYITKCNLGV